VVQRILIVAVTHPPSERIAVAGLGKIPKSAT
jgi:hypothetical protein